MFLLIRYHHQYSLTKQQVPDVVLRMLTARIYTLLVIEKSLLLIFYTSKRGYQFRIIKPSGEVLGTEDIFYSEEAALDEARCWLRQGGR